MYENELAILHCTSTVLMKASTKNITSQLHIKIDKSRQKQHIKRNETKPIMMTTSTATTDAYHFTSLLDVNCKTSLYGLLPSYRLLSVIVEETQYDLMMMLEAEEQEQDERQEEDVEQQEEEDQQQQDEDEQEAVQVIIPKDIMKSLNAPSSPTSVKRWLDDDLSLDSNESWDSELFDDIDEDEDEDYKEDEEDDITEQRTSYLYSKTKKLTSSSSSSNSRFDMTVRLLVNNNKSNQQQIRKYAGRAA